MKILVVNDDGYNSIGIEILREACSKYGDVTVVAPHYGQSGASSSITIRSGLSVHKHNDKLYSVEGTPSDCVRYALYGLKVEADIVLSGVNNGFNIGIDTIYSGTVGAAMEALYYNKKAIAFSTDVDNFAIVKREIDDVIRYILDYNLLDTDYLLNVNFPNKHYQESNGIILTDLGIREYDIEFEEKDNRQHSSRREKNVEMELHTDSWACKHGFISITPLKLGNGDRIITEKLRKMVSGK